MRKQSFIYLLAIIILATTAQCFSSCSKDDDDPTIVGTWLLSGDELIYVFNDNGKGEGMEYVYRDGEMVIKDRWPFTYTYDVKNGILVYTEGDGDTDIWDVISLTETTLVVREKGGTRTLTFIRQDKLSVEQDSSPATGIKVASIGDYKLTYNSDGRLKTASLYSNSKIKYRWEFSYNPNIAVCYDENGEIESQYAFSYNASGFITKMTGNYGEDNMDYALTYDYNGHLIKGEGDVSEIGKNGEVEKSHVVFTLIWNDDKLMSFVVHWTGDDKETISYTFSYDKSIQSKYFQYGSVGYELYDGDKSIEYILAEVGCFGKGPAFLPTGLKMTEQITTQTGDKMYNSESNFSYTFNSDGSLNSYTVDWGGKISNYYYSYNNK